MKKSFSYSLFALIALVLPLSVARAQTPVFAEPIAPVQTEKPAVPAETPVVESLSVRKSKAETDLRAIQAQFSLFTTRTQVTIDRLNVKNITTTKAQAELTTSTALLTEAKTNLDLLAAITIADDSSEKTTEQTTLEIKNTLKKIETNLKDARSHLVESLTLLKASVAQSIQAQ
jgi:hypothetical protein